MLHARTATGRVALASILPFLLPLASHLYAAKAEWRHEPPHHRNGVGKSSTTPTHRLGHTVLEGSKLLLAHILLHFKVLGVDAGTVRCSLIRSRTEVPVDASAWAPLTVTGSDDGRAPTCVEHEAVAFASFWIGLRSFGFMLGLSSCCCWVGAVPADFKFEALL